MTKANDGALRAMAEVLTPVAMGQIESALHQRRLDMLGKEEHPHAHACCMTLIISVEDEGDNLDVFKTVESLAGKYPIRVVGVQSTPRRSSDDLAAWVNAECEGKPSARICSEQVAIQGGVDAVDRIVSVVRGLLAPDLPVILWWRGGTPHGDVLWNGLRPMCDRIVVDSMRFGDGAAALDTLRRLVHLGGKTMSVRDLNWERTAPWRAAIASCFDDRTVLALLPDVDRCAITYAADGEKQLPSARAMLMAGWLISRLPRLRGHVRTAHAKRWSEVAAGRVVAIALTSSSSKTCVMLVRQPPPIGIEVQAHGSDGKQFRRWQFPAHTLTEAELLDRCLETLGSDPIFESALDV